ncbi:hypothetical protein GOODEAATRI_028297 [Goodea atripinnis]|uniref:Uncharacterized protein n=1 Tax=Goodea atripinnis TaxID=208336 RepID=A0ABV0P8I2_9TELE
MFPEVHRVVQRSDKITRPSPGKRKSSSSVEVGAKLHRRSSNVGRLRGPGMANKENEVTCSDDVRGLHAGLPTISADASKMAGASSKYADFTEVRNRSEVETYYENICLLVFLLVLDQKNTSFYVFFSQVIKGPRSYDSHSLWKRSPT